MMDYAPAKQPQPAETVSARRQARLFPRVCREMAAEGTNAAVRRELRRLALEHCGPACAAYASALAAFDAKAAEWGLPRILVFSKSSGTSSLLKALSGEYRRRVLIGEIMMTTKTAAIATYVVMPGASSIRAKSAVA